MAEFQIVSGLICRDETEPSGTNWNGLEFFETWIVLIHNGLDQRGTNYGATFSIESPADPSAYQSACQAEPARHEDASEGDGYCPLFHCFLQATSAAAWRNFILLFLEAGIVCRDTLLRLGELSIFRHAKDSSLLTGGNFGVLLKVWIAC